MAESTITQSTSGQATLEPTLIDLETGSDITTSQTTTTGTTSDTTDDIEATRRENAELKRQLERQRQQNSGAQAEARKLAERIAALEGHVSATATDRKQAQAAINAGAVDTNGDLTEEELDDALTKWLNNDRSGLSKIKRALTGRPTTQLNGPSLTQEDVEKLVDNKLTRVGTAYNLQTIVGTRHPDLANPESELTQAVWDQYDNYAQAPENRLLYPSDPRKEVTMVGPGGMTRQVDAALVDKLCLEIRSSGLVNEGRRQEARAASTGNVQTGNGRAVRPNSTRSVEAIELLTPGELSMLKDPNIRKGWAKLPADEKAAAKYLYDGFTSEEKSRRLAAYRQRNATRATA